MPTLIQRLPFGPVPAGSVLPVPLGEPIPQLTDRIVLWISIMPFECERLPTGTPKFPAVFDGGFNNGFLMQSRQLMSWASPGVYEGCLPAGMELNLGDETIPLYYASVWVYPNVPGKREPNISGTPYRLELPTGIALAPRVSRYNKPLPLIGLQAVRFSEMRVVINGRDETISIDVP